MEVELTLYINGPDFNPKNFNRNLPPNLRGEVCTHRESRDPESRQGSYFFASHKISNSVTPEFLLNQMVKLYMSHLAELISMPNIKRIVTVNFLNLKNDDTNGLFMDTNLINSLLQGNIEIDINVSC